MEEAKSARDEILALDPAARAAYCSQLMEEKRKAREEAAKKLEQGYQDMDTVQIRVGKNEYTLPIKPKDAHGGVGSSKEKISKVAELYLQHGTKHAVIARLLDHSIFGGQVEGKHLSGYYGSVLYECPPLRRDILAAKERVKASKAAKAAEKKEKASAKKKKDAAAAAAKERAAAAEAKKAEAANAAHEKKLQKRLPSKYSVADEAFYEERRRKAGLA